VVAFLFDFSNQILAITKTLDRFPSVLLLSVVKGFAFLFQLGKIFLAKFFLPLGVLHSLCFRCAQLHAPNLAGNCFWQIHELQSSHTLIRR
jgi:hypothetical protein